MAKGNLAACLDVTLKHEGGYSDHPRDPGGATNMGITHAVLAAFRGLKAVSKAEVKALTLGEAKRIYDDRYWTPICAEALPYGLDLTTFDASVNSGIGRGPKWLQSALGVKADGKVGSETVKAARLCDVKATIQKANAARLSFMKSLKIWETFKRGWSARVADVEAKSVAMWLKFGAGLSTAQQQAQLDAEADKATGKASGQDKIAAGSASAGTGGVAGDAIYNGDINWLLVCGVGAALLLLVVLLLVKAKQNRERAEAYAAAADAVH